MMFDPSLAELFWPRPQPQRSGPIRHGSRSSLGCSRRNQEETVPPPERKRARIEAGRAKLVAKAARSAERSRRDREGSR